MKVIYKLAKNNSCKSNIYGQLKTINKIKGKEDNMKNNKNDLDNNKDINKLLKENDTKMEIAKEVASNKKVAEILGNRLAKKKYFPPC